MRAAIAIITCLPMLLLLGSETVGVRKNETKELADVENEGREESPGARTTKPGCSGGCAAVTVKNKNLRPEEVRNLLAKFSTEETGKATTAIETLLFHGKQIEDWLAVSSHPLDKEHAAFLKKELKRGHEARVSVRILDADGVRRMEFEQSVPVGEKQHLHVYKTTGIATPILSFTVKRVGLHHLWTRL